MEANSRHDIARALPLEVSCLEALRLELRCEKQSEPERRGLRIQTEQNGRRFNSIEYTFF